MTGPRVAKILAKDRGAIVSTCAAAMRAQESPDVVAVQHIRSMRGGAQSHVMRCSDGHFYVVKFRNNPQHCRVLANEWLATRLAEEIGLPVPRPVVVEVKKQLIEQTPALHIQLEHNSVPCQAGLQFGSRYAVDPLEGQVFDYLPMAALDRVRNLETFAGILAFDKWAGNADGRQAAFWRLARERKYSAAFIDQGYCFNAGAWTFPDDPLRGVYSREEVYAGVRGWESFEPWLSRIETMEEGLLWRLALEVPSEWYGDDLMALENLVETLTFRRGMVRDLIATFRNSARDPFPEWNAKKRATVICPSMCAMTN